MSTEAITALASSALPGLSAPLPLPPEPGMGVGVLHSPQSPGFSDLVTQGLQQVNQQLLGSQTDLQQLAVGNAQNLHQIMIRLEESKLSFQLMMQVRNRLLESYQDVMKMQL